MNGLRKVAAPLRLLAGLLAGATMGALMGQGVDLVSSAVSVMAACVAVGVGLASTVLIRAGAPRKEKPSKTGAVALMVVLASYLVVGRLVWENLDWSHVFAYLGLGVVMVWLVFSWVAEAPLLWSFGLGGLLGAISGVVLPLFLRSTFEPLFALATQASEKSLILAGLGLLCALAGAFSAVAGRLSGWGLTEDRYERVWTFDDEGRSRRGTP